MNRLSEQLQREEEILERIREANNAVSVLRGDNKIRTRLLEYEPIDAASFRVGVVVFPGTLDDIDAARAVKLAGAKPVPLWHNDTSLEGVDAVVLAGGFSYGDYLRCGAIARFSPIMEKIIDAANGGLPVLGICNGFQILTESHLLKGALIRNNHQKFICKEQKLIVANNESVWSNAFEISEEINIPLKNGEGCFVADEQTLFELSENNQIVFKYFESNPNGSMDNIAGIMNEKGNVVGLMPHPEHAVEAGFGVDNGDVAGFSNGIDGLRFFQSLIVSLIKEDMKKLTGGKK